MNKAKSAFCPAQTQFRVIKIILKVKQKVNRSLNFELVKLLPTHNLFVEDKIQHTFKGFVFFSK